MRGHSLARTMWEPIETLHAVTYFGSEIVDAGKALGLSGFWMTYFGFRGAPLGAVAPGVIEATFFNFDPSFVRRWVPEVWTRCAPEQLVVARSKAAAATLRRVVPDIDEVALRAEPLLSAAVNAADMGTRALFAANRDVNLPTDPVERLWQLCTTLREHRGDGHTSILSAHGISGVLAHVLISADGVTPANDLQRTRGITEATWHTAVADGQRRGWIAADATLTESGRELRRKIERHTDELAEPPYAALAPEDRETLLAAITPAATQVSRSGVLPYPNPMGLPELTPPSA